MQSKSEELAEKKIELPLDGERLVDRYTIIKRVNLGGFGAVYRAIQDNLGRECALKVLLPDIGKGQVDYVEQFRQEALLTSQLRHPNTITIFDYGQTESGLLFLVMEWLDGKTLTEILKEGGALSYDRCFNISHQILKSLSEAHERGMVHRDLKPSNLIICTQYGEPDFVKVLDFGLVKNLTEETLSLRGKAVEAPRFTEKRRAPGTPHYMAPEQAMGKGTTTSADLYAFGLILHEMLTGKRAVDGADKMEVLLRQARQPVPPLPEEFRETFLGKVVERCVEKDPLKRPQTATTLLRDYQQTEEVRGGVELSNAEVEAAAKWRALAEPKFTQSEVSSSLKDIFVGRNDEIEEFRAIVKKGVAERRGTTIVVTGQTGIGKTTLVLKFSDIFMELTQGAMLSGVCLPQNYLAYSPLRLAIKRFLQVQSDDASDAQVQIKQALQRYRIQDSFLLNFLTQFIVGKYGQAGEEREETEMRLEEFFDTLARQTPVLLVIENLHWADANTLNLLWKLTLSSVTKARPFFMVTSFRCIALAESRELQMLTERFNRLDHAYYREMQLGWLGKRDCNLIIDNAIKMQRAMANQCLNLSKGNPLFLNLVLRYILDEKSLNSVDDAQKIVIPNSIEKITLRRIDQIVRKYQQEEYKEILRRAALIGETFSISSVEALLRKDGQYGLLDFTSRALEVWRREGILRRQWEAELSFEFIHPHIVEFFNADSSPELHLNVARTKEALSESDIYIDREDIARHFKLAGEKAQALRYLDFAANTAMQGTNLLKTKKIYEEMLPLLEDHVDAQLARRVYFQLGELSLRVSEFGPSHDYFTKTIALADAHNDLQLKGLAYCGLAELALAQNLLEEANSNYNRAKTCLPEDDLAVQGRLLLGMGKLSTLKADWQAAIACFQKAYDFSSNAADFDLMARALTELGKIYLSIGVLRQAHECFLAAQKNYQTVGNSADEASLLLYLSKTFYIFMRADDAHFALERALEIFQRLGDQLGVANSLASLASLNAHLLVFDEAQKFVLRSIPLFKEYNNKQGDAR
ncbi:MAG: protein kinase, partial [Bradymonadales bacterium]